MMDVEIPPAQDSPKHILNVLNDDCIQAVLRRIDNIRDFQSAAETCVRFQENAKLTFRSGFKFVRIGQLVDDAFCDRHTVVDRVKSFLSIFGHLISELDFDGVINDDIANMIADYCGKTLKIFKCGDIEGRRYSLVDFRTRSPFQALEELEICNTGVLNFKYHSQLRRFSIISDEKCMKFDWLIQTFPKLEIIEWKYLYQLKYSQAVKFLKLNPQLKGLFICFCEHIKSEIFQNMADWAPDLEKVVFWTNSYLAFDRFYENEHLVNISKLRRLTALSIHSLSAFPVEKLIDSFIENNVQIENLLHLYASVANISQLKSLKKLFIARTTDETLIHYVENLPELEAIFCDNSKITVNGIKTALQYGRKLSQLVVEMDRTTTIDLDDYTSILNLAKAAGVKVEIYNLSGTIDVTEEILLENRKWLLVKTAVLVPSDLFSRFNRLAM